MRRRKNTLRNIILIILLVILGVLIVCVFKDKKIDNNINSNNKNSNKIDSNISDKKDTNTDKKDETTKEDNTNNNSEPKKDEKNETNQQLQDNVTVNIELIGDEEITLNVGDKYNELGVKATDSKGNDVTKQVTIQNSVDTSKKGEYMVIYSIGKSMVIRNVTVK